VKALIVLAVSAASVLASAQTTPSTTDSQAIFERTKAATVIILAGEGAGRVSSIATGVVISRDGVILTPYHAIKGALEVQVRMTGGDIFDRVELLGVDERRDVAAIKISAGALSALTPGSAASMAKGDPVYAVTIADGLTWSATEGILSAIRPAGEVPGAGAGFHLLQFTAPVAPGSSGGALVDRTGALIGIIVGGKDTAAYAIPIENVLGLLDLGPRRALGSGAALQMPAQQAAQVPQSSTVLEGSGQKQILKNTKPIYIQSDNAFLTPDMLELLKNARTISIQSDTAFLTPDMLQRSLAIQKDWGELGLTIVGDPRAADLLIKVDRIIFTHVHTYVISDKKTTIVLASGQVTAFDGIIASGGIAKEIVEIFDAARLPGPARKQ
jgi:hypothetical protein